MAIHRNALRNPGEMVLETISLLQMVVGALGNVILFFHTISPILLGCKMRPTDVILAHVVVANLLIIFSPGIPHIIVAFVLRKRLSGLGCKFVYYIQRVARGSTLCSTCVLSTYQSFILTPRTAAWVMLRGRAPKAIGPSCCAC